MLALLDQHADDLDRAVEELGGWFDHLRQVGIRGFVAENTFDSDFVKVREPGRVTEEPEAPADEADQAARGGSGAKAPRKRSGKKR